MTLDLETAARLAREAAVNEVFRTMRAHGRYIPAWEVHEIGINYAIRNQLSDYFQQLGQPTLRVCCEYGLSEIKNVDGIEPLKARRHPVDLAVLHPIKELSGDTTPGGFAWAPQNCAALGLIEVKKDRCRAEKDTNFLSKVLNLDTVPDMRPLQWVLFVMFISGPNPEHVNNPALFKSGNLDLITKIDPQEAPIELGTATDKDRWFDIRCYGKASSAQ